jgi:putative DNA primase/helicase
MFDRRAHLERVRPSGDGWTAAELAHALGGRKAGDGWVARCPGHDDKTPSLSIRDADDGKLLVYCFAGCASEEVIGALRDRGLWPTGSRAIDKTSRPSRSDLGRREVDHGERTATAFRIWQSAMPADSTLVQTYFRSRGICIAPPLTLRFHPGLKHPSGSVWPATVALVTRGSDDKPLAVHRTFLARDGVGKAPVAPEKMMLGPCRGGAVRLAAPGGVLMVGEGIETCLSAMQATGYPVWAALSTSGLRGLDLPADVSDIIVLADGDPGGEAAATDCALRWHREGRRVRIAHAPKGADFNSVLLNGLPANEEGLS